MTAPRPGEALRAPLGDGLAGVVLVGHDMDWIVPVANALRVDGIATSVARDAQGLADVIERLEPPEVVIVDGGAHGQVAERCREVRPLADGLLFAIGSEDSDVLVATEAGADGFAVRSTSHRVLVARVRAMLRRGAGASRAQVPFGVLLVGSLRVVVGERGSVGPADQLVLDPPSFTILASLLRRPGIVVSREQLQREIGYPAGAGPSLDLAVRRLRDQLEPRTGCRCIVAVRGVGFRYLCRGDGGHDSGVTEPLGPRVVAEVH